MKKPDFIPYNTVRQLLAERLGATPDEIAMWIWLGPNDGGLAAYDNPNRPQGPAQFYFLHELHGFDYLSPLQGCYFRAADVDVFHPAKRFITAAALVERWQPRCASEDEAKAFVLARIKESRLEDFHPVFGHTVASSTHDDNYPPMESALFSLIEIEGIEDDEFSASDEFSVQRHTTKSVSSNQIIDCFSVKSDTTKNASWWNARLTNAKRYGLSQCRASAGRGKTPSRWYPDLVADWLVSKEHMSARRAADVLKARFPDCIDAAERLLSDGP